jgi:hypothetical protein
MRQLSVSASYLLELFYEKIFPTYVSREGSGWLCMARMGFLDFNDPKNGDISNDTYLQLVWEKLHGQL